MTQVANAKSAAHFGARYRLLLLGSVSALALALPATAAELSPGGGAPWVLDTPGTTTITGADTSAENAWIGLDAPGVVLAIDGTIAPASLTIASGKSFHLGINGSASGEITTLTGASPSNTASLIVGDQVFVGEGSDDNTLTLNAYSTITASSLVLGVNAGSDDNLVELLTGTSTVSLTSNLIIGNSGADNSVTLANGAGLDADGQVVLGLNAGASGNSLTLSSGATLTADLGTMVGSSAGGNSILVRSGAHYTTDTTTLGSAVGSDGNSFTVTGAGSTFTGLHASPGASFNVGDGGKQNHLTVSDGAVFSIGDRLAIGKTVGSTDNIVSILGTGSELHAGNVRVGINTLGSSGNTLRIADNGALFVTSDTKIYGGNVIDLADGAQLDMAGFTLFSGASFKLDVDAAHAIDFNVSGTAALNGTLDLGYSGGALSNRYLVLSAGTLTNNLTLDSADFAQGFAVTLDVEGNDLYLDISGALGQTADLGQNQQAMADALNTAFNGGGTLGGDFVALYGLDDADLGGALSALSGEVNAFAQTELGWSGTEAALSTLEESCEPATGATCVQPLLTLRRTALDGDSGLGTHDTAMSDVSVGASWATQLQSATRLTGLALLDQASIDLGDLGSAEATSLRVGVGLRQDWQGVYASLGGTMGLGLVSTDRDLGYKDSVATSADFGQAFFGLRGELGMDLALGDGLGLTPFAGLQWANNAVSGFDESITGDHPDLALSYAGAQYARTQLDLGLRLALAQPQSGLALSGQLAYRHVLGADSAVETTLAGLPDHPFDISAATQPTDSVALGLAANLTVAADTQLALSLDGSLGENYQSYGGKLSLTRHW